MWTLVLWFVGAATTQAQTVRYQYDAANRLVKVTAPDGKSAAYVYDAAGRLETTQRDLDPQDGLAQVIVTHQRYDAAGRPVAIAHLRKSGDADTLVAGQRLTRGVGGAISTIETFRSGRYDVAAGQFIGQAAVTKLVESPPSWPLSRIWNGNWSQANFEFTGRSQ